MLWGFTRWNDCEDIRGGCCIGRFPQLSFQIRFETLVVFVHRNRAG
jgi:hypothetical protein